MSRDGGTLCLTFDNMGSALAVGQGLTGGPGPDDEGPAGYPETLDLLDETGLKATFFVEGWNALHNPSALREIARRGHEVALHGWVHETIHALDAIAVERVLKDSLAAFAGADIRPTGFRAPGGRRGPHLLPLLEQLGFAYDSSVEHGPEDAAEHAPHPPPALLDGGIVGIPWQWPQIDYYHYNMHPEGERPAAEVERHFRSVLDGLANDGGFQTFIFHPFVSAQQPQRRNALREILRYAASLPSISVCTAGEVASALRGGHQWHHDSTEDVRALL